MCTGVARGLALLLVAGVFTACTSNPKVTSSQTTAKIGSAGGTARSGDGQVTVKFSPGQATPGALVRVASHVDLAAAPADLVRPITQPFEVSLLSGSATSGSVTVTYPAVVPADERDLVVIVLRDKNPARWRVLPTTPDASGTRFTATWPHFSLAYLGVFDPFFSAGDSVVTGTRDASRWAWGGVHETWDWGADRLRSATSSIARSLLPLYGGSLASVQCENPSSDWSFTGVNGNGGPMSVPALMGCASAPRVDGSYPATVGNHYPYPYLVTLAPGVSIDAGSTVTDPVESFLQLFWARNDRVVVGGGQQVSLDLARAAPSVQYLSASTDWRTVTIKAAMLAALVLTRGETAEVASAYRQIALEEENALYAARAASDGGLFESVVSRASLDSDIARRQRAESTTLTSAQITLVFDTLQLLDCTLTAANTVQKEQGSGASPLTLDATAWEAAKSECFPVWSNGVAKAMLGAAKDVALGTAQRELAAALISQLKELPDVFSAVNAGFLAKLSHGQFDYTNVRLRVEWTGTVSTPRPGASDPPIGLVWQRYQQGWGTPRPTLLDNGGDASGVVENIQWKSYGGARAVGTGIALYAAPGQSFAEGTREPASIIATDLGTCLGQEAYLNVVVFFPQHGETWSPKNSYPLCEAAKQFQQGQ